jgi:multicomponent Na+:H+ antiporter subunit E
MYRLAIFLLFFGIWIIFSGQFDAFHLTLGILSSAFITFISSDFLFLDRSRKLSERLKEACRFPGYFLWLLYQILLSNIHVLKLALSPRGMDEVEPSIIRIKTRLKTDFGRYVLANSITLTPGTITIDVQDDELLIHSISKHTAAGVKDDAMERRISKVFEGGEI